MFEVFLMPNEKWIRYGDCNDVSLPDALCLFSKILSYPVHY